MVGRGEALRAVLHALDDADRRAVVVTGARGIGKTRLASEAARLAATRGVRTFMIEASWSQAPLPFGVFAQLGGDTSGVDTNGAAGISDLRHQLLPAEDDRRSLLVIDRPDALDASSVALIEQLTLSGRILVVAVRDRGHPLPGELGALWGGGRAQWIDLEPLAVDDVASLAGQVLGGRMDSTTLHRTHTATAGIPRYLIELLQGGLESGSLVAEGDLWSWRNSLVVPRVVDAIEDDLLQLTAAEREAIELLAVAHPGGSLALSIASDETFESLERSGRVKLQFEGRRLTGTITPPILRDVVLHRMSPMRRRVAADRLAQALAPTGMRRSIDPMLFCSWCIEGGHRPPNDLLLRASRDALSVGADGRSEMLARAALADGLGAPAAAALASALMRQRRYVEAEDLLREHLELIGDGSFRGDLGMLRAENLLRGLRRPMDADAVLEDALRTARGPARSEVVALRAACLLHGGETLRAARLAAHVAETSTGVVSPVARLRGVLVHAAVQAVTTRPSVAASTADSVARDVAACPADVGLDVELWMVRLLARLCGAGPPSAEAADQLSKVGAETTPAVTAFRGRLLLVSGRASEAASVLADGAAQLRSDDPGGYLAWCLASLARARSLTGDAAGAATAIQQCGIDDRTTPALLAVDMTASRAWVAAAAGDLSTAIRLLEAAAKVAHRREHRALELAVLHDLFRLRPTIKIRRRIHDLAESIEGETIRTLAHHVDAVMAADADALGLVSEEFEHLGHPLLAAEAAAQAAIAARSANASGAAARMRALRLHHAVGSPWSPVLSEQHEHRVLTPREQEVAILAAEGLTSRGIADRLYLSRRTVDNHLAHVYAKLHVRGRGDLAAALGRTGPEGASEVVQMHDARRPADTDTPYA